MVADKDTPLWKPSPDFWNGRHVLVTGHTGFKGGWLSCVLSLLQAEVFGYSLDERPSPNAYDVWKRYYKTENDEVSADIVDQPRLLDYMRFAKPEVVIHLAAQPLVIESYHDPLETVRTNVLGTASLLDACRRQETVSAIIVVTTDKVYREEGTRAYIESDPLGGGDIYSSGKACCELLTESFRESFFSPGQKSSAARVATARAGNVIGGGDWSENRLLPDLVRAHRAGRPCLIRNPLATRPWQHVLEPLLGYLCLTEKLVAGDVEGSSWNFGPSVDQIQSVRQVADAVREKLRGLDVAFGDVSENTVREMENLRIDSTRAKHLLGWEPKLTFDKAIELTCNWYDAHDTPERKDVTERQITEYLNT